MAPRESRNQMTKIDPAAFTKAHTDGMHRDELAAHFGIAPSTVTRHRRRLGLSYDPNAKKLDRDRVKTLVGQGLTAREISKRLGCSEKTIGRIKLELGVSHPYRGRPMTETRLHAIWQMLYDGWSHEEIHRTEGADVETIRKYFPGTAWTFRQAGEHQAALRILNPRHFNAHPKHYDRTKYEQAA